MPNLTDELITVKERSLNHFGTAVLVWCGKSVKFGRVCRTFVELNLGLTHGTPSESDVSSDSGHWGTQRMPPPRYCFGLLFSDLIDRLLFKTHQKFKMAESARRALGECSELSDL